MLLKQVRKTSLNSISISGWVTKKEFCIRFNKFVPKVKALMLRIFASGERKTPRLHSNEVAAIVVVEIQLRIDDDSSITA
jgi:hypothetical protein